MACTKPITGYYAKSTNPSGKRSIVFDRKRAFSDLPVVLPCGMCLGCRIDKARQWSLRCVHEAKQHVFNSFVTLTYEDDHLPSDSAVNKRELQLFFKKLRKAGFVFRYYASGEYGTINNRPHYHVLFFGIDFHEDRRLHRIQNEKRYYTSETLTRIWGNGRADITGLNITTAQYVAKYIIGKKLGKDAEDDPVYSRLDLSTGEWFSVNPEFVLMSRRPGIGSDWYDQYHTDAFPSDFLVHEGRTYGVPRYYTNKLRSKDESAFKPIRAKRRREAEINKRTPEQLDAKHIILQQKENQNRRNKV